MVLSLEKPKKEVVQVDLEGKPAQPPTFCPFTKEKCLKEECELYVKFKHRITGEVVGGCALRGLAYLFNIKHLLDVLVSKE
ncbi:hypothetical protein J7J18_03640 [bacterium]|nr:hypothetical protein [bacterium]